MKIFIRNNFSEEDTIHKRQRFTWAHEICHALLYDLTAVPPKPAADTPKDAQLEALCQSGAGYLLMPTTEIKRMFNISKPISSIDDVVALSEKFGASYEVVVRRLKQVSDCLRADYALLLLRNVGGENAITAAAHDIWLKTLLPSPGEGQTFSEWAKPFVDQALQVGPNDWEKGRVKMRLQQLSRYWIIAEFKQT